MVSRRSIAVAIATVLSSCSPVQDAGGYEGTAANADQPSIEIVSSITTSSKVVAVDPPKWFRLTFEDQKGRRGEITIAKRCSQGWKRIPVGSVRDVTWITYRSGQETWTKPIDEGRAIYKELCA